AVAGQIEGGSVMGHGYALSEEIVYTEGCIATPSFAEYLIPTPEDVAEVAAIILESHSGLGPYGAKGIGEPSFAPVAPAVANAVADALGVRIFDLPITPERIVKAIKEKDGGPRQA
ncbi:MAG: molybdopterin cofactor-binding domain-containing protein, partial [Alphaproteobacteria bacterium]